MGVSCELLSYYGTAYHDDIDEITEHLKVLGLFDIPEIQLLGKQKASGNIYSFNSKFFDMSDMAEMLADANIAVRCGQMCAYPYAQKINGDNCILRISTSPYNTYEDCKKLVTQIKKSVNRLT
jgi:cysteine sulfinate desulfinase